MIGRKSLFAGLFAVVTAVLAAGGLERSAQASQKLSRIDKQWLEKDVASLITMREASKFRELAEDQRERFKELFWARRDTNPSTPENEFLDSFNARIRIADQYFKARGTRGSLTDMGKIFTLLGQPSRRAHGRSVSAASAELASGGGIQDSLEGSTSELMPPGQSEEPGGGATLASAEPPGPRGRFASWIYTPEVVGGTADLEFQFRAMPGFGYRLLRDSATDEILDTLRGSLVTRPDIDYELDEAGNLAPVETTFVSTATIALDDLVLTHEPSDDIDFHVESAYFRSTEGSTYVPLLFQIQPDAVSFHEERARLTFFGAIADLDGAEYYRFEEPAEYGRARNAVRFELPLQLPPGDYTVFLGVVDEQFRSESGDAAPFFGSKVTTMSVPDFSGDTKAFSSVVIYDRAEESSVSPGPGNGFQFGRVKLRPIGRDPFTPSDALGLFYYVYGVEDGARVTAQYVFFLDGAEVRQTAAEEMPSASGQAVGAVEIPLTSFVPGDYRLLVRVKNEADGEVMETWLRFTLEV